MHLAVSLFHQTLYLRTPIPRVPQMGKTIVLAVGFMPELNGKNLLVERSLALVTGYAEMRLELD